MISFRLKKPGLAGLVLAISILLFHFSLRAESSFEIVSDFPGGNVLVDQIEGEVIHLSPDNRDTTSPRFYWYFGVKGAEGKTLRFVFKPTLIGQRGPGISRDGGVTWEWMGIETVKEGAFSYTFPKEALDIRFSVGIPYVPEDFERFFKAHQNHPDVKREVLTKSLKGREVPLILISKADRKSPAPYTILMTARHHACEMMASWALEGSIAEILADTEEGTWLRENVDFFIVPFVDYDGVTEGHQGKNRVPHDHNRDYIDEIYPEVAAIKKGVPEWLQDRPFIFMDYHCPGLRDRKTYFLDSPDPAQAKQLASYLYHLKEVHQGSLPCDEDMVMKFGQSYNKKPLDPPRYSRAWALQLPGCLLGSTLEIPFSNVSEVEVNADSAREFGRDMARGYHAYLKEQSTNAAKKISAK